MIEIDDHFEALVDFVTHNGHTTFIELAEFLASRQVPTKGECALKSSGTNVFIWLGMSTEFFDLALRLQKDDRVSIVPAHPLTYLHDGGYINLPLVRRAPANGYKDPHWLPVCFCCKKKTHGRKQ